MEGIMDEPDIDEESHIVPGATYENISSQVLQLLHYEIMFTLEQRRQGAVVIHFLVCLYAFAALAILCDDYFCASLNKICKRLNIHPDVAGATFMAAGSSMPTMFISVTSVFLDEGDIGLGTIIGSTMFNILFITGICGIATTTITNLKPYSILRDCAFYFLYLIVLLIAMHDGMIHWYEALIVSLLYLFYVLLMYHNTRLQHCFNTWARKHFHQTRHVFESPEKSPFRSPLKSHIKSPAAEKPARSPSKSPQAKTVDQELKSSGNSPSKSPSQTTPKTAPKSPENSPSKTLSNSPSKTTSDAQVNSQYKSPENTPSKTPEKSPEKSPQNSPEESATQLTIIEPTDNNQLEADPITSSTPIKRARPEHLDIIENGVGSENLDTSREPGNKVDLDIENGDVTTTLSDVRSVFSESDTSLPHTKYDDEPEDALTCPSGGWKRVTWTIMFPIRLLYYFTVPDCRLERWESWYVVTFIMSICWMGVHSYVLVWAVSVIGATIGIPECIMGLTLLAAGSSVPDAIASLVMARQHMGDMALANAIGSNIFDMLCLSVPWLLSTTIVHPNSIVMINGGNIVYVSLTLFGTVITTLIILCQNKWRLDRKLGCAMLVSYVIFLSAAVVIESHPRDRNVKPLHRPDLPHKGLGISNNAKNKAKTTGFSWH